MGSERGVGDDSFRRQPKRPGAVLCVLFIAGCVFVGTRAFFLSWLSPRPIPDVADIARIEAEFYDSKSHKNVTFLVPQSYWNAILSAMLPAEKDDHAAKWEGLGSLQVALINGNSFHILLYERSKDPGAFSAGPTIEQRIYYRGGSSSALKKALSEAWTASKKTQ